MTTAAGVSKQPETHLGGSLRDAKRQIFYDHGYPNRLFQTFSNTNRNNAGTKKDKQYAPVLS